MWDFLLGILIGRAIVANGRPPRHYNRSTWFFCVMIGIFTGLALLMLGDPRLHQISQLLFGLDVILVLLWVLAATM